MWAIRAALLSLCFTGPALAVSKAELEARIQQLEKKLQNVLLDQNDRESRLRREIQQLLGDMEVQSHEIRTLQKKQRDLYLDIDRRLNELKQSGQTTAPTYGGAPGGWSQSGATTSGAVSEQEQEAAQQAYDQALETLKQGKYGQARAEFKAFLKRYPDSSFADNAQYWVGEVAYVTREFPDALREFDAVISRYPGSSKIADARLKIGFINYELKQWEAARSALSRVTTDYPGSTSARLAGERLQRMAKEGR